MIRELFTSTENNTFLSLYLFHWNILSCIICHWHLTEFLFFYDVYILPFDEHVLFVKLSWKEENKYCVLLFDTNTILSANKDIYLEDKFLPSMISISYSTNHKFRFILVLVFHIIIYKICFWVVHNTFFPLHCLTNEY